MNRPRARELAANHRRQYINNMPNNLTPSANRLPEPKRIRLGAKLKTALDHMVFDALPFDEAARKANLTTRAMRMALERRPVRAYLREQKQVFRESVSAGNILTLREIRDHGSNDMARVKSVQVLETLGDVEAARGGFSGEPTQAGLVIQIVTTSPPTVKTIEHDPTRRDDDE
jgi:hypothetical protein